LASFSKRLLREGAMVSEVFEKMRAKDERLRLGAVCESELDLGEGTALRSETEEDFDSLLLDEGDVPKRGEVGRLKLESLRSELEVSKGVGESESGKAHSLAGLEGLLQVGEAVILVGLVEPSASEVEES